MNSWIVIAIAAGLASAAMLASIVVGSPLAAPLTLFAPMPLFIIGFGSGPVSAAVAGLAGAIVLAVGVSVSLGAAFLMSVAAAPVILSRIALINRPSGSQASIEGEASSSDLEWYPEGRLMLWAGLITFATVVLSVFVFGDGPDALRAELKSMFDLALVEQQQPIDPKMAEQMKAIMPSLLALLLPVGAACMMLLTMLHMMIASRILVTSGNSLRPWAPFGSYKLPKLAGAGLAATTVALFIPGLPADIVAIAFALMLVLFTVIGLATLHGLTTNNPMRLFILTSTYFALFALSSVVMIPLAILGLVDQHFDLRGRRQIAAGPKND